MEQVTGMERRRSPVTTTFAVSNVLVFLLWMFLGPAGVMSENFLVSWAHLASGRLWTLITAVFSHLSLTHLLINMIVLLSFGPALERLLGSRRYITFYLVAGAVGSLAHAVVSAFLLGEPAQPALGASSALSGVLLFFALAFPRAKVLFFFLLPLPAIVAALIFVGIDIWGLVAQARGGGLPIGHGAHLGGALAGGIYYLLRRDRLSRGPAVF